MKLTPPELREAAEAAREGVIPAKSKDVYEKAYARFMAWLASQGTDRISENTLLPYFREMLKEKKPTTMWSEYSALKKMLRVRHAIDISAFASISDTLKQESKRHQKKKAATFTSEQVDEFLEKAPDTLEFQQDKLALLLGLYGGLRSEEYCSIQFEDVQMFDDHLKVTIKQRKTDQAGEGTTFFALSCQQQFRCPVKTFRRYRDAFHIKQEGPLFRQVRSGKVTQQKRGKTFFYDLPKRVAEYLRLDDKEKYTGHAIRRTATTWLAERGASTNIIQKFGGWKSASVAQGYIDDSDKMRSAIATTIQSDGAQAIQLTAAQNIAQASTFSFTGCTVTINYNAKE